MRHHIFQSTLPREERPRLVMEYKRWILFQSTLPREERRIAPTSVRPHKNFNPRSHERSDMKSLDTHSYDSEFQSTLPREERHTGDIIYMQDSISIHAPTRGATTMAFIMSKGGKISIHAPTRGATSYGCDIDIETEISIHAPTRGATSQNCLCLHH